MLLKPFNGAREHLLHQPIDDFDAGEITLVHGSVGGLARKSLLVQGAIAVAIEEAAKLVLQFADTQHRLFAEAPGHVLIGQPFAAIDRIHEVALNGVTAPERHVVAALHHPGAAGFAHKPLNRDRDPRAFRGRLLRMERCKQARAPTAKDQDVCVMTIKLWVGHTGL